MEQEFYDKFIIFLSPRYFCKSLFFKSIYEKVKKRLTNKGIKIFNIDKVIDIIKNKKMRIDIKTSIPLQKHNSIFNINDIEYDNSDNSELVSNQYDDMDYPIENTLYVHLFNGKYYNDKIYPSKKLCLEREMLFLLAGTLGVKEIYYHIKQVENIITKNNINVKVKGVNNKVGYCKKIGNTIITEGEEKYLNNGAPIYCKSSCVEDINKELKENIYNSNYNIFNYEFYKSNIKLETFVYKRFIYKMHRLSYSVETEDITDISFTVQSCFADYGLQLSFEQTVSISELVTYNLLFYDDKELQNVYFEMSYYGVNKDPFFMIKQYYETDTTDKKEVGLNHIKRYVFDLVSRTRYKPKDAFQCRETLTKRLQDYIRKHSDRYFKNKCKEFNSTLDIKNWIYNHLIDNNIEEIVNKDFLVDDINFNDDNKSENEINYLDHIKNLELQCKNKDEIINELSNKIINLEDSIKYSNVKKCSNETMTDMSMIVYKPLMRKSNIVENDNQDRELVLEYKLLNSKIIDMKKEIEKKKVQYENIVKNTSIEIEAKLIDLSMMKSKLFALNERQMMCEIKAIGKLKDAENSFNIIDEGKNALKKLFTTENNSLEKQIKIEKSNLEELQKEIDELKTLKENMYLELKKNITEYDILVDKKNSIEISLKDKKLFDCLDNLIQEDNNVILV